MKVQKEELYLPTWSFMLFPKKPDTFTFVWTIIYVYKDCGKRIYNTSNSGSFQGHYIIKFSGRT